MATITSGVSAGSPSASDASGGDSSTSHDSGDGASTDLSSELFARASELAGDASDEPDKEPGAKGVKASPKASEKRVPKDDAKAEADDDDKKAKPDGEAVDDADKKSKTAPEGFVPKASFERRVSELTSVVRDHRSKLSAAQKEIASLKAALSLTSEQGKKYAEMALKGVKLDPKDAQLAAHELKARAEAEQARVDAEHQATLDEQAEADQIEEAKTKLEDEIDGALSKNDLIGRPELVAALKEKGPDGRRVHAGKSVAQVAAQLQQRREAAARKRFNIPEMTRTTATSKAESKGDGADEGAAAKAAWPKTAKARAGGNAGKRYEPTLESMLERAKELETANR